MSKPQNHQPTLDPERARFKLLSLPLCGRGNESQRRWPTECICLEQGIQGDEGDDGKAEPPHFRGSKARRKKWCSRLEGQKQQ